MSKKPIVAGPAGNGPAEEESPLERRLPQDQSVVEFPEIRGGSGAVRGGFHGGRGVRGGNCGGRDGIGGNCGGRGGIIGYCGGRGGCETNNQPTN